MPVYDPYQEYFHTPGGQRQTSSGLTPGALPPAPIPRTTTAGLPATHPSGKGMQQEGERDAGGTPFSYTWPGYAGGAGAGPAVNPSPGPTATGYGTGAAGGGASWSPMADGGGGGALDYSAIFGGDPGTSKLPPDDFGLSALLAGKLKGMVTDGTTRYTPEVIEATKAALKSSTDGQLRQAQETIKDSAAQRGQLRAGATGAQLAAAGNSAASDYSRGVQNVMMEKAKVDFDDRMKVIDETEQWINSTWQHALQADMNDIQRQQLKANLQLAVMKMNEDRKTLERQLQFNWQLAQLGREPIEGKDFMYVDTGSGPVKVPISALSMFGGLV